MEAHVITEQNLFQPVMKEGIHQICTPMYYKTGMYTCVLYQHVHQPYQTFSILLLCHAGYGENIFKSAE